MGCLPCLARAGLSSLRDRAVLAKSLLEKRYFDPRATSGRTNQFMTQEMGENVVIESDASPSLLDILRTLEPIDEDFAPIADPAPPPDDA